MPDSTSPRTPQTATDTSRVTAIDTGRPHDSSNDSTMITIHRIAAVLFCLMSCLAHAGDAPECTYTELGSVPLR